MLLQQSGSSKAGTTTSGKRSGMMSTKQKTVTKSRTTRKSKLDAALIASLRGPGGARLAAEGQSAALISRAEPPFN
jgi:hypothetical protein